MDEIILRNVTPYRYIVHPHGDLGLHGTSVYPILQPSFSMFVSCSFVLLFISLLNDVPCFFFVYLDGNLHLTCLQVLLGRSDVSGWGAFLKVFTKLMIQFEVLFFLFPNAIWLNSRIVLVSMNTLESILEN